MFHVKHVDIRFAFSASYIKRNLTFYIKSV